MMPLTTADGTGRLTTHDSSCREAIYLPTYRLRLPDYGLTLKTPLATSAQTA
ncbi:MAG: hypothetical protein K0S78_6244, partial [Thermomicrobiales bacterium]|nr:hypothetical protein [Thermomicrobiales bacterium]